MGEIADDHVNQMLDEGSWFRARSRSEPQAVTCKRCGTADLHWQLAVNADGYPCHRLFDVRNRPHQCASAQPDADDFGVVA